jgi:hypothetical protein
LRTHVDKWRDITDDQVIINNILYGIEFNLSQAIEERPPHERHYASEVEKKLDEAIADMDEVGVIHWLSEEEACVPGAVFSDFVAVAKKGTSKIRPAFNLRYVNESQQKRHFKMEGLQDLKDMLQQGDWMAKLDIKNAFWHMRVHPRWRHLLRFHWKRRWGEFVGVPFGICWAPREFTKLMKVPIAYLRLQGVSVIIYLDDILIIARSQDTCKHSLDMTIRLLEELGFEINYEKSLLTPVQEIEWIGFVIDSVRMVISVPQQKLSAVCSLAESILVRELISRRELASFLGKLGAMAEAVLPERARTRALFDNLRAARRALLEWDDEAISLTPAARAELFFWANELLQWNGRRIKENWDQAVTTRSDASFSGWGGNIQPQGAEVFGWWTTTEAEVSNNRRELEAARRTLTFFVRKYDLHDIPLVHESDNSTAVAYMNRGQGRVQGLAQIAGQLWDELILRRIDLQARFIPGDTMGRVDMLSRRKDVPQGEWQLNKKVFEQIDLIWGPHQVDLFASFRNKLLPLYFSYKNDPESFGVDSFLQSWDIWNGFANPPFALIGRVLHKVRQEKATITLIAPWWPSRPWFPDLTAMAIDWPLLIDDEIWLTSAAGTTSTKERNWRLAAWKISGKILEVEEFRARRANSLLRLQWKINPTIQIGECGRVGAMTTRLSPCDQTL